MAPDSDARRTPAWVRAVDGAMVGGVLAFALWTLFYELALATQWNLWWPARVWLVLAIALVGWCGYAGARSARPAPGEAPPPGRAGTPSWAQVGLVALVVAVLVVLALLRDRLGILPLVVVGIAVLVGMLVRTLRRGEVAPSSRGPRVPRRAHVVAGLVSLGLAVLAFVTRGSSPDDIYYLNRATWVDQHGTPTLRDTMFSPGTLPSTYPSPPTASIEAWQGAVAHVLGLAAPTFVFLWTVPLLAAASGWATWRLVRTWAPRRALLVYLLATLFTLFSAKTLLGHYSVLLLWEGKVPAVTVVVPLAWHYLTRVLDRPRPADLVLLLALGTDFVGLTTGAALVAPTMAAAALVAALLVRSRAGAVGAGCFALAPVLAGIATLVGPGIPALAGSQTTSTTLSEQGLFDRMFGDGAMTVVAFLAVVLGTCLMRGRARVLAACAVLAGLATLLPGFLDQVTDVTGAGSVAWRMIFVLPAAIMVGMLATVQLPPLRLPDRQLLLSRPAAAAVVGGLAVLVVLEGVPLWSPATGTQLGPFEWKVDQAALRDVRAVAEVHAPPGLWLLPQRDMGALTMTTTRHTAVVPWYLFLLSFETTRTG
ncbi:MAG: hypothetical protein JOZ82_05620, partial [Marmoricola sp.]|nr:hypothetical protein [Marmoricola sp.]